MADDHYQSAEQLFHHVRVGQLPYGITAKEITAYFGPYGTIKKLYLRRRVSKESTIRLSNPSVTLVFDKSKSVDQIMTARPLFMDDHQLFIRRCLPITKKYPHEAFITVKKIIIRTQSEKSDEVLPDDKSIVEYLTPAGGKIEYFQRLDDKTVLVQFDDYDPVDICCLSRPHFIKNQPVEIEKCSNEEEVRHQVEFRQKSNSKLSPSSTTVDTDNRTMDTASPTPTLSIDDQLTQLRSTYNDITSRLEREHEQLITSLSNEWKQTAKERIRLQRLTLDYKQEYDRLTKENRKWQKLYSTSLQEKPNFQIEGEQKLKEAGEKTAIAQAKYNQLIQNIRQ